MPKFKHNKYPVDETLSNAFTERKKSFFTCLPKSKTVEKIVKDMET